MHYLLHRGVVREDHDTTKLHIVFDASAKLRNELSLNDILYSGPCLLPYLHDMLLRFRTGKTGLVGDIEQAFLQVEIAEEHRDFIRFLWFKDINETPHEIYSFCFWSYIEPILTKWDNKNSRIEIFTSPSLYRCRKEIDFEFTR